MVLHRVHHQILRSHHLFEPLNEEQMEELLNASQLLNLDKGDNLFHQGEPAHNFYFVISGAVKVYRLTPDGQEKVFEVIGNRQTFAEAMMLMDTPNYVASAQAVCPSQVYRFSNAAYMRLLEANQRLTFALLGKLCVRLHQRINEIETLSLKNATTAWCAIADATGAGEGRQQQLRTADGQAAGGRAPVDPAGDVLTDHPPTDRRGHHHPGRSADRHPRSPAARAVRVS